MNDASTGRAVVHGRNGTADESKWESKNIGIASSLYICEARVPVNASFSYRGVLRRSVTDGRASRVQLGGY